MEREGRLEVCNVPVSCYHVTSIIADPRIMGIEKVTESSLSQKSRVYINSNFLPLSEGTAERLRR